MAFVDNKEMAERPGFRAKVEQAMLRSAVNISSEASNTTNHPNRAALSKTVLLETHRYVDAFAFAAASDGATTDESTDQEIENRVSSLWNALAGVL